MSQTFFACGCIVSDGIRSVDCGTHGAENPDPLAEAVVPEETPAEKKRIAEASAALARGEEPKDTRTPAEKKADKQAAKGA
jgi:hypothetical protein